jgi:hypothetical protein
MGERRYNSTILDLGSGWSWMVTFKPKPLYHRGKSHWWPLDTRMDRTKNRSGRCGVQKSYFPCRESNRGYPAHMLLPYRLSCPGSIFWRVRTEWIFWCCLEKFKAPNFVQLLIRKYCIKIIYWELHYILYISVNAQSCYPFAQWSTGNIP